MEHFRVSIEQEISKQVVNENIHILIHNIRQSGFATNSSSSHSLIFNGSHAEYDRDIVNGECVEGEFGWDEFILDNSREKKHYLAIILYQAIRHLPEKQQDKIMKKTFNLLLDRDKHGEIDAYIDHQSVVSLPKAIGSKSSHYHEQFFKELTNLVLRPDVHIIGGNDNGGDMDYVTNGKPNIRMPVSEPSHGVIARYDEVSNYWTLFNPYNGSKISFSFQDDDSLLHHFTREYDSNNYPALVPDKAFAPELVDMKITDYCPYDCPFCYMGSTRKGSHALASDIYSLVDAMAEHQVFEIAIGGGEPTLHPSFIPILKYIRSKGIIPNFTTRNLKWLEDSKKRETILDLIGSFAYSADTPQAIKLVEEKIKPAGWRASQFVNIHVVMGLHTREEFAELLTQAEESDLKVTLLGYKYTGRGDEVEPKNHDWWLDVIHELKDQGKMPAISVDTVLAEQYEKQILEANIPKYLFRTKDGGFSAYIDAVTGYMKRSSYTEEEGIKIIGDDNKERTMVSNAFKASWDSF